MKRRDFVRTGLTTAAAVAASASGLDATSEPDKSRGGSDAPPFTMNFAPHFGMFTAHAGEDPVAELQFMHEVGFRAVEDNLMRQRPLEEQERIGREIERLGMTMGLISAMRRPNTPPGYKRPQISSDKPSDREELLRDLRDTIPVAKRVGAGFVLVTPGQFDPGVELGYQMVNAIENLRVAAKVVEPHGLTMLLEPLNPWANHPGAFVTTSPQLFELVRAVDSPAFKMLFDLYHLQISEGNLIANFDRCLPAIGYVQSGDVPGRNEPGTGEINYNNVFAHIHARGYRGIVGTEHGLSKSGKEGEQALIEAYRRVDPADRAIISDPNDLEPRSSGGEG